MNHGCLIVLLGGRYGQSKTVYIWRFIVQDTIDSKIYDERHRDWDSAMKS